MLDEEKFSGWQRSPLSLVARPFNSPLPFHPSPTRGLACEPVP